MSYIEHYEILAGDTDASKIARPSVIMRYMQETANHHMRDSKPSYNDLYDEGKSFILSRMNINVYENLCQYDKIDVKTWPTNKGVTYLRSYQIIRDGIVVAEATGTWALIDINTKRFLRCNEVDLSNYGEEPALEKTLDKKARIPDDVELKLAGEHIVRYFDTDINGHVNNTNYPDILANFIPDIDGSALINMTLHFVGEAKLGETIKIFVSKPIIDGKNRKYFVRSAADEKPNVVAEFVFAKIEK